ncbi:TetR/AcrR family transcriptional regulator C-terminal domain-containing protein [Rhodococcus fascians]|nr:TetR/AcrR family transcriptional regulator C-terminal domain-containing protein [Rhodococcus fascians]MBY4140905.1 TetR/AcrR family transcriptional regulator C-terminal domain-containing protein [Rhodococcus fascians]MBY4219569.1 TetR/AcrR family transcriptional regulator C-terminal domain-containing protein [Rhodococcus fascians]MBY4221878.1 TetR/AcrR family transcriptional regulator C-terminal domain-containing protein [Rhodococcus fascians]MBY4233879.1 TetR/AcrR family transcriptional reg
MARPRTALLDIDRIVDQALQISDATGDFTIAQLAAKLAVHPSSLYHHVSGRDEVIDRMRARIGREIDNSGFGTVSWDEAMQTLAWSYRAAFARHPGSIRLLAASRVRDPESLAEYERIAEGLHAAGFTWSEVLPVIIAFDSFILGSALDMSSADNPHTPDPQLHPALSAAVGNPETRTNPTDVAFEMGLSAMLTGLKHRLVTR